MIFEEFDPNIHDSHKVAELMYSVDFRTYLEVFKTKENAIVAIKDLLSVENEKIANSKNQENIDEYAKIYVILDDNDFKPNNNENSINSKDIIGILHVVKGKKYNFLISVLYFLIKLKFSHALKFSYISLLDSLVLTDFNKDDLYLAEISIDESQRGKGLGTKIIKKVIEKARKKGFKRVVLDSDLRNTGATKLYESIGFKKFDEKSPRFFKKERGMNNMEYTL